MSDPPVLHWPKLFDGWVWANLDRGYHVYNGDGFGNGRRNIFMDGNGFGSVLSNGRGDGQ